MYLPQNLNSLLTDCSYCSDSNQANTTNDLYLQLSLPAPKKVETAAETLPQDQNNDIVYDVLGRRVNPDMLKKGTVYIQKGKKIIIY